MNYIIIGGDGKEYGPISETDVRQWIAEGRLNAQSKAKAEGDAEFRPLGKFPEFAALLPSTEPPLRLEATGTPPVPPRPPLPGTGAAPAPLPPPVGLSREEALRQVNGPAVGLLVTGGLGLLFSLFGLLLHLAALGGHQLIPQQSLQDPEVQKLMGSIGSGLGVVEGVIALGVSVVILLGALKMKNLTSHSFAMTAAVVAMVPCLSPCCLLGLPFGIWALTVISKPEIKAHFD